MGALIDRDALLAELRHYIGTEIWNAKAVDLRSVPKVLEVVENLVKGQKPRKQSVKERARQAAIECEINGLSNRIAEDKERAKGFKTVNALAGYTQGLMQGREEALAFLRRISK